MTAFNFNNYILKPQQVCINSADYTFTNAPTTMSGLFLFFVTPAFESNNLQQIIIMDSANIVYTRSYDGESQTFGDWHTITGASEGYNQALTTSATTINPGQSATITVAWGSTFSASTYVALASVSSTNDQPLIANIANSTKTTTHVDVIVTNNGTVPVTSVTLNLIGKLA